MKLRSLIIVGLSSLTLYLQAPGPHEGVGAVYINPQPKTSLKPAVFEPTETLNKTYAHLIGNNYTPGNCTWWAAENAPVIIDLGNANTWDDRATAVGVPISDNPTVGAVAQTDRGALGHVAVVKAIDGDMVLISEMNSIGLGIVDEKWVPADSYKYLYF